MNTCTVFASLSVLPSCNLLFLVDQSLDRVVGSGYSSSTLSLSLLRTYNHTTSAELASCSLATSRSFCSSFFILRSTKRSSVFSSRCPLAMVVYSVFSTNRSLCTCSPRMAWALASGVSSIQVTTGLNVKEKICLPTHYLVVSL
jgi:hypothetical protein